MKVFGMSKRAFGKKTACDTVRSCNKRRMQHQLERIWRQTASLDITYEDIEDEIQVARASKRG